MPRELMEEGMKHKHLTTPWEAHGGNVFAGKHCIAICDTDNADEKVYEAKARLMAAAPALLSALKAFVDCYEEFGGPDSRYMQIQVPLGALRRADEALRAALAQAAPTPAADRGEGK